MKKMIVGLLLLCTIIAACVQQEKTAEEIDLIKELQDIERELANDSAADADIDAIDVPDATGAAVVDTDTASEDVDDVVSVEEVVEDIRESLKNNAHSADVDTSTLQRIQVEETGAVDLSVDAADDDKDPLTFTFSSPLDNQGKWTTTYGDAGEYVCYFTSSHTPNSL